MNIINSKILITGGSSGIGLELTKQLLKLNNKVIICSSNEEKLILVKKNYPEIEYFQCDLSDLNQCENLVNWIYRNHNDVNILINNAAIVHRTSFIEDSELIEKATQEFKVNFLAVIYLSKKLYSIINKNEHSKIINITTGLIYAPKADYTFYNATKSALHSFTQVLRIQLNRTSNHTKIIEVMFPAVDTSWHKGNTPKIAISVKDAVKEMLKGINQNKEEIRIRGVKKLYLLSRIAPKLSLKIINSVK